MFTLTRWFILIMFIILLVISFVTNGYSQTYYEASNHKRVSNKKSSKVKYTIDPKVAEDHKKLYNRPNIVPTTPGFSTDEELIKFELPVLPVYPINSPYKPPFRWGKPKTLREVMNVKP